MAAFTTAKLRIRARGLPLMLVFIGAKMLLLEVYEMSVAVSLG
jgi:hypothetical protein